MFISPFTPKWAAGEGTGEEEGHPPAVTLIYASPARFANQTLDRIDKAGSWLLLMRRLPPLTAVRAFEAAARTENFTAAAAELGLTQAAVSYQVKALEERLGADAAGRRESFTAAAAERGLTQAAVSYQVKALEERLGAALFVRERGRAKL